MGLRLAVGVMGVVLAGTGAAVAAPSVQIRGAAVRVSVRPQVRNDIVVTVVHADLRLPLRVQQLGDRVYISGDVGHRVHGCRMAPGRRGVAIWGRGSIPYEQLPQIIISTPMAVRLTAGDAVFGDIGPSVSVDFTNMGCGDWAVADVQGRLRLDQAGAGDTRTASAGSADLSVAGTGGVTTGAIRGGVTALSSGSGAVLVGSVFGPLDARVAGPGGITVAAGSVSAMTVSIAGSGAVTLHGTARTLKVSIAGSGDVSVDKVTGQVTKQVFGSGAVRVGR